MRLPRDLREFIELLNSESVEYAVAGGWALGYYGRPRHTQDLDIVVRSTPENAARLERVLQRFGFASFGPRAEDFLQEHKVVQLGFPPQRIDVLTGLTGVEAEELWTTRETGELDGLPVFFLARSIFVKNKRAVGRTRDLADLEDLGE